MEAEAQAGRVKHPPYDHFGSRVLLTHASHDTAANLRGYSVCHPFLKDPERMRVKRRAPAETENARIP